jgi:hypothetical protein
MASRLKRFAGQKLRGERQLLFGSCSGKAGIGITEEEEWKFDLF